MRTKSWYQIDKALRQFYFHFSTRWTHVDGNPVDPQQLDPRTFPGQVSVELVPVLVPLDRVQGLLVQVVVALHPHRLVNLHVLGYLQLRYAETDRTCKDKLHFIGPVAFERLEIVKTLKR